MEVAVGLLDVMGAVGEGEVEVDMDAGAFGSTTSISKRSTVICELLLAKRVSG